MWNENQRQILTLDVGGKTHKLDPLPVLRRYRAGVARMGEAAFRAGLEQLMRGEETPQLATVQLPILYEIMGWTPYAADPEGGYLEGELLSGFTQFLEWVVDSKKKGETSPPSAPSAGPSDATPPTTSTSLSSSAGTSSTPEEPGPSAPAPASP